MSDKSHVRANAVDPDKVEVIIQGESCSTFNVLSRAEAFVLAGQIITHLKETGEE